MAKPLIFPKTCQQNNWEENLEWLCKQLEANYKVELNANHAAISLSEVAAEIDHYHRLHWFRDFFKWYPLWKSGIIHKKKGWLLWQKCLEVQQAMAVIKIVNEHQQEANEPRQKFANNTTHLLATQQKILSLLGQKYLFTVLPSQLFKILKEALLFLITLTQPKLAIIKNQNKPIVETIEYKPSIFSFSYWFSKKNQRILSLDEENGLKLIYLCEALGLKRSLSLTLADIRAQLYVLEKKEKIIYEKMAAIQQAEHNFLIEISTFIESAKVTLAGIIAYYKTDTLPKAIQRISGNQPTLQTSIELKIKAGKKRYQEINDYFASLDYLIASPDQAKEVEDYERKDQVDDSTNEKRVLITSSQIHPSKFSLPRRKKLLPNDQKPQEESFSNQFTGKKAQAILFACGMIWYGFPKQLLNRNSDEVVELEINIQRFFDCVNTLKLNLSFDKNSKDINKLAESYKDGAKAFEKRLILCIEQVNKVINDGLNIAQFRIRNSFNELRQRKIESIKIVAPWWEVAMNYMAGDKSDVSVMCFFIVNTRNSREHREEMRKKIATYLACLDERQQQREKELSILREQAKQYMISNNIKDANYNLQEQSVASGSSQKVVAFNCPNFAPCSKALFNLNFNSQNQFNFYNRPRSKSLPIIKMCDKKDNSYLPTTPKI